MHTFTSSPAKHALWRNNCTNRLLLISSRLATLGNDSSWEATKCSPPTVCHLPEFEHSSAPRHPEDQDISQPLTFRSSPSLPAINDLVLWNFQGRPLRSMDLRCAQQGHSGLLGPPWDPEGLSGPPWDPEGLSLLLKAWLGGRPYISKRSVRRSQVLFHAVHDIGSDLEFFVHITQRQHSPYHKEVRQQPWANFEGFRGEKSPRGQL